MRRSKQTTSIASCILMGVFITLLFSLLSNGIITVCMLGGKMNEGAANISVTGSLLSAIFIGTLVAGKMRSGQYGIICGVITASILLLQIATNIIFFDGKFHGFIINLICALLGGGLSCGILMKGSGKRRKRR